MCRFDVAVSTVSFWVLYAAGKVGIRIFSSGVVMNVSAWSTFFTLTISFCMRWQTGVDCCKIELCHMPLCVKSVCKHPHSRNVHLWIVSWLTDGMSPSSRVGEWCKTAWSDKCKAATTAAKQHDWEVSNSQCAILVHILFMCSFYVKHPK